MKCLAHILASAFFLSAICVADTTPAASLIEVELDVSGDVDTDLFSKGASVTVYCRKSSQKCDQQHCVECLKREAFERESALFRLMHDLREYFPSLPAPEEECAWKTKTTVVKDTPRRGTNPGTVQTTDFRSGRFGGKVLPIIIPSGQTCSVGVSFADVTTSDSSEAPIPSQNRRQIVTRALPLQGESSGVRCTFRIFDRSRRSSYFENSRTSNHVCVPIGEEGEVKSRVATYMRQAGGTMARDPVPDDSKPGQMGMLGSFGVIFLGMVKTAGAFSGH